MVMLGGWRWTIDFSGSYDWKSDIIWIPHGAGLAVTKIAQPPEVLAVRGPRIAMQLWGAEKLSLSNDTAFDRMKESSNGIDWVRQSDHTDDEGPKGTPWYPLIQFRSKL